MVTAYLCIPPSVNWEKCVEPFIKKYQYTYDIKYHIRGHIYESQLLENAEVVVIFTADNSFNVNYNDLPLGIQKQFRDSFNSKKEIYLAYKTQDGRYNFYLTNVLLV
jgi:hypothetical protein